MRSRHQFDQALSGVDTVDGAVALLGDALKELGISRLVAGFVRGRAQAADGVWRRYSYRTVNLPQGWDEGWHEYNAHCPYYRSCFDGRMAFDYKSVRQRNDLSRQETRAWQYLADQGLREGFVVPVHAPGHFGFITLLSDRDDQRWHSRIEAHAERLLYLSHAFHATVRERFPEALLTVGGAALSARERDCLRWAAAGKTTEETAMILGVAHETVRIYFKRALRKLNATTRTQAVALAQDAGLLD